MIAQKWLKGEDVVEIGFGTGQLAVNILPYVNSYVGVEQSKYMCNIFTNKLSKIEYSDKVTIFNEDVLFLDDIIREKVDVVIEHDMLYLVNNTELILKKINNVIKPNGLFIRIVDKRDPNGIYNNLMKIVNVELLNIDKKPHIIRGIDSNLLINFYLSKMGIKTKKIDISSWYEKVNINEYFEMIRNKQFPYLQYSSDVAINNVIDNVKNKLVSMNLADRDYFLDKIDCFCLVSKFE